VKEPVTQPAPGVLEPHEVKFQDITPVIHIPPDAIKRRNTMKQQRIYVRPDPDLPDEEAKAQMVDAFMNFFADQAEADGNHELAARLRAQIARKREKDNDSGC
jgi:hypothetical protein